MEENMRLGVVADDITGANDIGAMLAKNGLRATVISLADGPTRVDFAQADALIIHTGSRLDTPEAAAEKSARAARLLLAFGCQRLYTKTCSVFRGNIGASFDAVQDAAGAACSMVVLGFPRNGRTTVHGLHYVHGVLLEHSPFRNDPVNPMRLSRLKDILAQQSSRPAAEFPWEWLDEAEDSRKRHLEELKRQAAYVIFDVRNQADLDVIARLIRDEKSFCGASALCEALPAAWGCAGAPIHLDGEGLPAGGVLIVSGSLTPQTLAQTDDLLRRGVPCVTLEGRALLRESGRRAACQRAGDQVCRCLSGGQTVLLRASQDAEPVGQAAREMGLSPTEVGRIITDALGETVKAARRETGVSRILVAGGETSDGVSRALGVRTMEIGQELAPGVPLMRGRTAEGEEMLLVFKSGSFGSDTFLWDAAEQLSQ